MPRIRCHYEECIFLDAGFCTAERIELDPEMGCLTFQQADEAAVPVTEWEDDEENPLADEEGDEEEEVEWEEEDEEDDDDEDEDDW
ncbi:MAG: hypothetical protein ACRDGG_00190 [Anaerolineae bacterium]